MKKYQFLLLLAGLIGWQSACKNPLEGFELKFKKALPVVREIQLTADNIDTLTRKATVRVCGPGLDKIVSPLNSKKLKLTSDGYLYLSLDSTVAPTVQQPIQILVIGQAPDYFDGILPIEITDHEYISTSVELAYKLGKPTISEKTGTADKAGLITEALTVPITAPALAPLAPATLLLPKGSALTDAQKQPVGGPVTVRVRPVDNSTTQKAIEALPGSGFIDAPLNASGKPDPNQRIQQVIGAATLLIYSESCQMVSTLSPAAELRFPVNAQLYNPVARRLIQPGDAVPVFSYDQVSNQWQREAAGLVVRNASNTLECVAAVPHLSTPTTYVAAFTKQACTTAPTFKVSTGVPDSQREYRCQIVEDVTETVLQEFTSTIFNGKVIPLRGNLESNTVIKLRMYDTESQAVVTSGVVDACDGSQIVIDLSSFKTPPAPVPTAPAPAPTTPAEPAPTAPTTPTAPAPTTPTEPAPTTPTAPAPTAPTTPTTPAPTTPTTPAPTTPTTPAPTTPTTPAPTTPAPTTPAPTTPTTPAPTTPTAPSNVVTILLQFPCDKLDESKLPTKEIYSRFRLTGTTAWKTLPVMKYAPGATSFSIQTTLMTVGKTYDLEAGSSPGNYPIQQLAYVLDNNVLLIRLKTREYCVE